MSDQGFTNPLGFTALTGTSFDGGVSMSQDDDNDVSGLVHTNSVSRLSKVCYSKCMTDTTTPTDIQTIKFFAYGTLREGQRLHNWIANEVIASYGIGTMKYARLFYARGHKGYPYLKFTGNPADNAIGELYELPVSEQVVSMLQMEQNAGYKLFDAEVFVNGEPTMALVCAWEGQTDYEVPDNDWCSSASNQEGWL